MPTLTGDKRSQLLSHLLADQSERWQRGEPVRVEHYLAQHPTLAGDTDALLDLVHAEMRHRLESGERPSVEEYLLRFPQHAELLRHVWPQLGRLHPQMQADSSAANTTAVEEPATSSDLAPLLPTFAVPGFELHEKLGEGGMGIVYRARDLRLDQPRALKVIRTGPFAGKEAHARFNREAKAVARLDHSGVVRIHALSQHEETLYICMDYLEGGSLQMRLRQGRLEIRAAADLVRQLALAVQHAHDHRVLHRDLKPANVLLTADGAPKVTDFGLAKLLDTDDDLTHSGAVMGTPAYMAPEQADGRQSDIREWTDIWSLGVILYECLTGRAPFKGQSRSETLQRVKTQAPAPPRELRAEIPAELEVICLKCLAKEPNQRYGTAAALAADLQAWLDGKAARIRPVRGPRRLLRVLRRRPRLSLLVGGGLLAAMLGGLLAYVAYLNSPPSQPAVSSIDPTIEEKLEQADSLLLEKQKQFDQGNAAELVGATGKPDWSRWRLGEKDAQARLEADGAFVVHGWPLTLLELWPDTGDHGHYRIHAEIRHLRTTKGGAVGVYFAGASHRSDKGPVLSFVCVTFNDLEDAAALFQQEHPQMTGPAFNSLDVISRYYAASEKGTIVDYKSTYLDIQLFKPSGNASRPGKWRTLDIEVSPARVHFQWEGTPVGRELNPALVEEKDKPILPGLVPHLNLRGGVGLYLYGSFASFRNVRIEPLDRSGDNP